MGEPSAVPPASPMAWGVWTRLALAGIAAGLLWTSVGWALAWWE